MLTKTKIALAVALVIGSASVALAETEDGGIANRQVPALQAFQIRNAALAGHGFVPPDDPNFARSPQKTGK
jgi:hypothetical protein